MQSHSPYFRDRRVPRYLPCSENNCMLGFVGRVGLSALAATCGSFVAFAVGTQGFLGTLRMSNVAHERQESTIIFMTGFGGGCADWCPGKWRVPGTALMALPC